MEINPISAADLLESPVENTDTSIEDINQLNIILNNNRCGDSFFSKVCNSLENAGLAFRVSNGTFDIDTENSTGTHTLIFAPYDNTRLGDSDSLTLSMKAAFEENHFLIDDILGGKVGFRQDDAGNVDSLVPTETEDAIDPSQHTSFVTISFGTMLEDEELIAKSILNGLVRQKRYLDHYDTGTDLIYRASSLESVSVVADYFSSSVHDLCHMNQLRDLDVLEAKTIINPNVQFIDVFNPQKSFELQNIRNKAL